MWNRVKYILVCCAGQIFESHTTTQPSNSNCSFPVAWFGDGECDIDLNNAGCLFDGGDCCKNNSYGECHNEGMYTMVCWFFEFLTGLFKISDSFA